VNKSSRTRRSTEPRRACSECRQPVPISQLDDADLCASCLDQAALFDLPANARPRRHDGRWL
jgi:hypothetical protein